MKTTEILRVRAREILDSRANPTVSATVTVRRGLQEYEGAAAVPSGASTGEHEARELRDGDESRYHGRGVLTACAHVNGEINAALRGCDAAAQEHVDARLRALDGTDDLSRLGANAVLAVSLAAARAAANAYGLPLYRYLGGTGACTLPVPMMNILNGGAHAANNLDIQEFMIVPTREGATFAERLRMCAEVYHALRGVLVSRGLSAGIGDEGGFAPNLRTPADACGLILEAIGLAGYTAGESGDFALALDAAASEWVTEDGAYRMPKIRRDFTPKQLSSYWKSLCGRFPIISIEDPFGENDWESWAALTRSSGRRLQLVGDDLFVTNAGRIRQGIELGAANAVLIKPNQIGTLSDTFGAIETAKTHGYRVILSHRSGETEDSFLADLAVAAGAGQIKTGAPARGERTAKYNRLLAIEDELLYPAHLN
ncbi:MAG: phosphopyruvate hydratase [Eubacteriales bacterium]|nr:phosphopyruvate hydratase [Clostridiales bacterium]MDY3285156.1 phosphopyruvate hydratase [Eubacteriales bacterium]MDY5016789.1 phosphopyruvate hydratase [Eubacteriales bacterium]